MRMQSFDQELNLNANEILPMITWGTSPQDVITIDGKFQILKVKVMKIKRILLKEL